MNSRFAPALGLAALGLAGSFLILAATAMARSKVRVEPRMRSALSLAQKPGDRDPALASLFSTSPVDTFVLGAWDFDSDNCTGAGWTSYDNSAQLDSFWHVDQDTAATCLDSKVMWCGKQPSSSIHFCNWSDLPGYGNKWTQWLVSQPIYLPPEIEWSFRTAWDTEPGYDFFTLQYDSMGTWVDRLTVDGQQCDSIVSVTIKPLNLQRTKLRFQFTSDGAYSDEDGDYVTSWGAVSVDDILVTGGGDTLVPFEDWEDEAVGSVAGGEAGTPTWRADVLAPVGNFVGYDVGLWDDDPCRDNYTCQLHFLNGSTETDPNYPGIFVTPRDIDNEVWSPVIEWNPGGSIDSLATRVLLEFETYVDLPLGGSVFFTWAVRTYTGSASACPSPWASDGFFFYGDFPAFKRSLVDLSPRIGPDPFALQIRFACIDLCDPFCLNFGFPGTPHTPSPRFDNVRIFRLGRKGPLFSLEDADRFQDDFPQDGSTSGTVRIDIARDIGGFYVPGIDPGDSLTLDCSAPQEGGLTAPPVMHVKVARGPHTGLTGASLAGDMGAFQGASGAWTSILMDSARTAAGIAAENRWAADLNDALFLPGDVLLYYFTASTMGGRSGSLPADTSGANFFEVSCLPDTGHTILYVDDFDGLGAEPFYVSALEQAGFSGQYDKYDVNHPEARLGNGPGGRVKSLAQIQVYDVILWNSGHLDLGTISDGTFDEGNDALLLSDYLEQTNREVGVWISGDNVARDLINASGGFGFDLLRNRFGVEFVSNSQLLLTGIASPVLHAEAGSPWAGSSSCSTHVAYGSCNVPSLGPNLPPPGANLISSSFDVIETFGSGGAYAFTWPGHTLPSDPRGAVITSERINGAGKTVRTIFQAYSFHDIRDDLPGLPIDRTCLLRQALLFLGGAPGLPTGTAALPIAYTLDQNHPNPFNPVTRIGFALPRDSHVELIVYDVAGQRIKRLLDEHRRAGLYEDVIWDGTNEAGRGVTSGVYFYRMQAGDFIEEKKMVLLK